MAKEQLSNENKKKLKEAIQLTDQITLNGKKCLEKFPTDSYPLEVFLYINYLERFVFNFDSINLLLRNFENKPHVETTIGLTIRASLLDFMILAYLSTLVKENKGKNLAGNDSYSKAIDEIACDQLFYAIRYLKEAKKIGAINKSKYETAIKKLHYNYYFAFKETGIELSAPEKNLLTKKFKSPEKLFKILHNSRLTTKFSKAYDLYSYYSKYEHYGIMTHFMQRQGVDHDFKTMITAMKYMVRGTGLCLSFLSGPKDFLKIEKERAFGLQSQFDAI